VFRPEAEELLLAGAGRCAGSGPRRNPRYAQLLQWSRNPGYGWYYRRTSIMASLRHFGCGLLLCGLLACVYGYVEPVLADELDNPSGRTVKANPRPKVNSSTIATVSEECQTRISTGSRDFFIVERSREFPKTAAIWYPAVRWITSGRHGAMPTSQLRKRTPAASSVNCPTLEMTLKRTSSIARTIAISC